MKKDKILQPLRGSPMRTAWVAVLILLLVTTNAAAAERLANVSELQRLAAKYAARWEAQRTPLYYEMIAKAADGIGPTVIGPKVQLIGTDSRGLPRFYTVDNADAATTTATDAVWPGGVAGYNLSGATTDFSELASFDAGYALATHQEFAGRLLVDGAWSASSHSTHVAGTMIAAGIVPQAKGMSFAAELKSFTWANDTTKMAQQAALGLLISNHSYGFLTGWHEYTNTWVWYGDITVSTFEEYQFGFYSDVTAEWDEIAYNAPQYLIVKSAGNDRDDVGPGPGAEHYHYENGNSVLATDIHTPDGSPFGFDTVGSIACAKNILTVGAIKDIPGGYTHPSDVVQTEFSAWGPADDGRIKPDIVACGDSVYSASSESDTSYAWKSGTSMATPNVSGSVNLLKDFYLTTFDAIPLSSTLKALVIHTADEAGGADGPDYANGWGLLNTRKAADVIAANYWEGSAVIEAELYQSEVQTANLTAVTTQDVRLTIAWTDPPATPPPAIVDPVAPMLVNDLDLRLESLADGTIYLPWRLDRTNPLGVALKRDNVVDNVERIDVAGLPAGDYRVVVSHKNLLSGGVQNYSIVWSGLVPTGTVTSVPDELPSGLQIALLPAYPNPFNPQTTISFYLPEASAARLEVFDTAGRLVRVLLDQQVQSAGQRDVIWNGRNDDGAEVASAVYIYRLEVKGEVLTNRMTLVK